MQKIMKKSDGVTLTAIIIMLMVILIICGISLNYGISTLQEVADNRTETELAVVQQAIVQQYTLLLTQNEDDKPAEEISSNVELTDDSDRPESLIGTRIADETELEDYGFTEYLINYSDYETMVYEYYYYYLDMEDLETLGVEMDSAMSSEESKERAYIVNYSTGEVFDIATESYYTSEDSIYLNGSNSKINETTYNFTDE